MTLYIYHDDMDVEFVDVHMVGGPLDGQCRLLQRINGKLPFFYAWFPDGVTAAIYRPAPSAANVAIVFHFERDVPVTELGAVPD